MQAGSVSTYPLSCMERRENGNCDAGCLRVYYIDPVAWCCGEIKYMIRLMYAGFGERSVGDSPRDELLFHEEML